MKQKIQYILYGCLCIFLFFTLVNIFIGAGYLLLLIFNAPIWLGALIWLIALIILITGIVILESTNIFHH